MNRNFYFLQIMCYVRIWSDHSEADLGNRMDILGPILV